MNTLFSRLLPHALWTIGIGVIVLAVVTFGHHGVPYQDPTPEQVAARKAWSLFGSFLFLTGILWVATRHLRNRTQSPD